MIPQNGMHIFDIVLLLCRFTKRHDYESKCMDVEDIRAVHAQLLCMTLDLKGLCRKTICVCGWLKNAKAELQRSRWEGGSSILVRGVGLTKSHLVR